MARRIAVHHFVANLTTRQYGPHPTSDLLGVDDVHEVPADTEFPRFVPRIDLFTRFYLVDATPCEFYVRLWWLSAPRRRSGRLVEQHGPCFVPFPAGSGTYDHVFRLNNVRLVGAGNYTFRLVRYRPDGWNAGAAAKFAETHFRVRSSHGPSRSPLGPAAGRAVPEPRSVDVRVGE